MGLKLIDVVENVDDALLDDIHTFVVDLRSGVARLIATQPGTTFRDNIFVSRSGRLVFKSYALHERKFVERLRAKWRIPSKKFGHRFGWAEWLNARQAFGGGVNVAAPIAYLEAATAITCSLQVVAFEKLNGYKTMLDLMKENGSTFELMSSVEKSIWELVSASIFHIDLNCRNILINISQSASNKIIDWEYACFQRNHPFDLYLYYLGYLYFGGIKKFLDEHSYDLWVLEKLNCRYGDKVRNINELLGNQYYCGAKTNVYSREFRYSLFL